MRVSTSAGVLRHLFSYSSSHNPAMQEPYHISAIDAAFRGTVLIILEMCCEISVCNDTWARVLVNQASAEVRQASAIAAEATGIASWD